jgi:soluble lytic murein transglycosylase
MRFVVSVIVFIFYSTLAVAAQTPEKKSASNLTPLQQQRAWYSAAEKALSKNQTAEFQRLLDKLGNYPLKPYLEYKALIPALPKLPREQVDNFLVTYPNSLMSSKLTQQWLKQLATNKQWENYIHYYDSRLADTELTCWYLEARTETEDATAIYYVEAIWNQGKSLPDACDNIVALWKKSGYLTNELIWQRFTKAADADNKTLATFLSDELPSAEKSYAQAYLQIQLKPQLLKTSSSFQHDNPYMSDVILRGVRSLAESNAIKSLQYFQEYSAKHHFSANQIKLTVTLLANQLIKQKYVTEAIELVSAHSDINDLALLDSLLRDALSRQDWERVNAWLQRYPEEIKKQDRWRYWMARTMKSLEIHDYMGESSDTIFSRISTNRSFYGFIAAMKLQQPFSLMDHPVEMTSVEWASIESKPGFLRAREFHLTGNKSAASQEWFFTVKNLPLEEMIQAAHLANKWGNHLLAIQTLSSAQFYDDLALRFPVQYQNLIDDAANQTQVDKLLIYSVIRQESVFTEDIKSPANAYGLMQLLHSTAQQVAKQNKIKYQKTDLVKASKNIPLGSRYLKSLLKSFDGNRLLATAAYNAGPGRVRQWMKQTNGTLPFDIWVEIIPFNETRQYVQNVLAFHVIYAYRLGLPQEFLNQQEVEQLL